MNHGVPDPDIRGSWSAPCVAHKTWGTACIPIISCVLSTIFYGFLACSWLRKKWFCRFWILNLGVRRAARPATRSWMMPPPAAQRRPRAWNLPLASTGPTAASGSDEGKSMAAHDSTWHPRRGQIDPVVASVPFVGEPPWRGASCGRMPAT